MRDSGPLASTVRLAAGGENEQIHTARTTITTTTTSKVHGTVIFMYISFFAFIPTPSEGNKAIIPDKQLLRPP